MTPGQAAIHDGALRLNSTVMGWTEYGTATFGESWLIACDASGSAPELADSLQWATVAGSAVDEAGAWWAWKAAVPYKHCGLATTWAECLTLLLVVRCARRGALVLADHDIAVKRARAGLRKRQQRGLRSWRKVEAVFGDLPLVPPSADARVQHYAGHELHGRAHRISNVIRRGDDWPWQPTWLSVENRCTALAAGWSGMGKPHGYLPPDLPASSGSGAEPEIAPPASGA